MCDVLRVKNYWNHIESNPAKWRASARVGCSWQSVTGSSLSSSSPRAMWLPGAGPNHSSGAGARSETAVFDGQSDAIKLVTDLIETLINEVRHRMRPHRSRSRRAITVGHGGRDPMMRPLRGRCHVMGWRVKHVWGPRMKACLMPPSRSRLAIVSAGFLSVRPAYVRRILQAALKCFQVLPCFRPLARTFPALARSRRRWRERCS